MSNEYIYLEGGIVIDDAGEIIDNGNTDALAVIAQRRMDAKAQQNRWKGIVADYDRVLLRQQDKNRAAYGDVVITLAGGSYKRTNTEAFADDVADMLLEFGDMIATIAAATGFDRAKLPERVRKAYDDNTETLQKAPWVLSTVAMKQAPEFHRGPSFEGDD